MQGVSLICFAASYLVALGCELTRFVFRSRIRGAIMIGFAGAGLFAHTIYLFNRSAQSGSALSSPYDWYLVAAWAIAALYVYVCLHHYDSNMGAFILPVVLSLIAAAMGASKKPFEVASASLAWRYVHSGLLLLSVVTVIVGFLAGLMYLLQSWRLKHGISAQRGIRLPSLEWLERVNSRSLHVTAWLVAGGFFSGLALNHIKKQDGMTWHDPAMLGLGAMLLWSATSSVFSTVYQPARTGRKVAYLTMASMVFLVIALAASWSAPSNHPALGNSGDGLKTNVNNKNQTQAEPGASPDAPSPQVGGAP